MARNRNTTTLDTRVLDGLIRNSNGHVADAIAKTGFAIEARAKIRVPVDTGALRASIYTSLESGGGNASGPAPIPTPTDNLTAYVGPSMEYGPTVELGGHNQAAQPYLLPAVRDTEREFREWIGEAVTNYE